MSSCRKFYDMLSRKIPLDVISRSPSLLANNLTISNLISLGVGGTMGIGIYVLVGEVTKSIAGPAAILSLVFAAITAIMSALCFSEFGARVPRSGSAYVYCYIAIGEFIAFLIGWSMILEYAIGTAIIVKALSTYFDALLGDPISKYLTETLPMDAFYLGEFPDFFAFGLVIIASILVALNAKESTIVTGIFSITNLFVVVYLIIAGIILADVDNWSIPKDQVPDSKYGNGGFFPYGFLGVFKGAAVFYYGFFGFDCIASAGEEALNPQKAIPIAIITSMFIIFLAYFGITTTLTLMVPYYYQDISAPLPNAFKMHGWRSSEYIVSISAILGLCACSLGILFPLPRIIYAMASDGLLFKFWSNVHHQYKTPFFATILSGLLVGSIACIFNLNQIVTMISIGTLFSYAIVAACVIILRYEMDEITELNALGSLTYLQDSSNNSSSNEPTKFSSGLVTWIVALYSLVCFCIAVFSNIYIDELSILDINAIVIFSALVVLSLFLLSVIANQPISTKEVAFRVPFLPWLPGTSIFINFYLMCGLGLITWIKFLIWLGLGLLIYFTYGIQKSNLNLARTHAS